MRIFSLLLSLFILGACTHSVHLVQVSDYGSNFDFTRGEKIEGNASQFVVMGFVTQTDYVDQAYSHLMQACPSREIRGVTTEFWTSHGFFSWTNKVRMQAYCQR